MKKPKNKFISFSIHAGTFDYGINVIISEDLEKCAKYVNDKLETTEFSKDNFQSLGKVFIYPSYCPIVWLPKVPSTKAEEGTLIHELLHIVFSVTQWAGIEYSDKSEEIYTHLLKYLFTQFYEKLNNEKIHKNK